MLISIIFNINYKYMIMKILPKKILLKIFMMININYNQILQKIIKLKIIHNNNQKNKHHQKIYYIF